MPPKNGQDQQKPNNTEQKLKELLDLKNKGLITEEEYKTARLNTIGLNGATSNAQHTIENEQSKQRRELLALVTRWIGTAELPKIADDLWDQLFSVNPDEGLRIHFSKITGKSRRRREITTFFREAGKNVTPPALIGATETHEIARRSARDFLLELAAALATSQCQSKPLNSAERFHLWGETLSLIQDEDTVKNATCILQNLKQKRNTIFDTTGGKRPRDDEEPDKKATFAPEERLSKEKLAENKKKGLCHKCGGHGHIAATCPSKK